MSVFLTITAATQLCAGCTVEFEATDTLGAAEDPAGVGVFADVLDLGPQGYLVSSEVLGGVVIVYDSEGRYQRELTREGDGPGELRAEPRFAMGAGGIVLWPAGPRLHLFSNDVELSRTVQVPGRVNAVFWDQVTDAWLVGYIGVSEGSEPGTRQMGARILLLDQSGDSIRSLQFDRGASPRRPTVDAIRGADNTIWTASMDGVVEVFDQDLGLLGSLELDLPLMDEWPGGGYPSAVTDLRLAPDGVGVWVFAMGAAMSLSEIMEELERLDAEGREPNFERLMDTIIYSVRLGPNGLTLVGTDQLDTIVRPLGDGDRAFDLVDTPDGNRRVRVGRLRFSGGSR